MCKEIYVENGVPIGCDLDLDYNDPTYHQAMDYLEGRIKPNYPVPSIWYKHKITTTMGHKAIYDPIDDWFYVD